MYFTGLCFRAVDMSCEDLLDFYESIDFEIVESFETPSPSGTIKLKHVFPMTAEAREDYDKDDGVDLIELAGRGGQKVVYKGHLHSDGRDLALAFMNDSCDLDEVESFFREARIAASLKHPSIVNTHNFGIDELYGPYSVMDWVEGETLHHVLRKVRQGVDVYEQVFTIKKLTEYFLEICKAVSFAHSKDIIHLDIKPENIIIDYDSDRAFLFDWGLSKAFSPLENFTIDPVLLNHDTKHGYFRGTPGYMPPEQITEQKKSEKTDIYQLGALLYTIIFKHCPVEGDDVEEVLEKTLRGDIYVDSITKDKLPLISICKKAMNPDPEKRYSDVRAIINELKCISFEKPRSSGSAWHFALAALLPLTFILASFLIIDSPAADFRKVEIAEFISTETIAVSYESSVFMTGDDISLLEEFSHFGAEEDNTPMFLIEKPIPTWYTYLDNLIREEISEEAMAELNQLIDKDLLITFYSTEDGL